MNQFKGLDLRNVPPRTAVSKRLRLRSNVSEGNLAFQLVGGWSEYKPEDVIQIIEAMQSWMDALVHWHCEHCNGINQTTPKGPATFEYKWVRCRHCKKKTPYADIFGLTDSQESV
jgi:hypothetical protein